MAARGGGAVVRGVIKHPVLSAAGAAGVMGAGLGTMGGRMSGSALTLPGSAALAGASPHHKGHKLSHLQLYGWRKPPRMNPCNPRALRRAIRRARGFEKLARRVMGFSSPHKPKGRVYFKAKRRR
jgi:hypothetical protein